MQHGFVGLLDMGLNQMKRNIRYIPAQRRALLKNKRKHTANHVSYYPHHNVGHWTILRSQNGPQGQKVPNTLQQLYTHKGY